MPACPYALICNVVIIFIGCSGRVVTTAQDAEELAECSVIEGPLLLVNLELSRNHAASLHSVTQITHFLFIESLGSQYRSLGQLLPNLAVIRGHKLYAGREALVIRDNVYLRTIGLPSLPKILKGNVSLSDNPVLVGPSMQDWQHALYDNQTQGVDAGKCNPLLLSLTCRPCESGTCLMSNGTCELCSVTSVYRYVLVCPILDMHV